MKEQKGITLIALVITIIVLLILAGVSIAMLTGQNGILTKATTAKDESTRGEVEEAVKLGLAELQADMMDPTVKTKPTVSASAIAKKAMSNNTSITETDATKNTDVPIAEGATAHIYLTLNNKDYDVIYTAGKKEVVDAEGNVTTAGVASSLDVKEVKPTTPPAGTGE